MADYDYLDQLIKNAEDMQRRPASMRPFVGPPAESDDIQVQPENTIVGEKVRPIEFSEGYKPELKQSDLYRENVNRAIEQRQAQANAYTQNALDLSEQNKKRMMDFDTALRAMSSGLDQYKRDPTLDYEIKKAQEEASNLKTPEKRNLWSEMILSFAPAIAGAVGGESAALAAPTAGKQARDIYEGQRKEEIELSKEQNKQILDKYQKLLAIDQKAANDFLQRQKLNVDMGRAQIEGLKFASTATAKDLTSASELAEKANKQITDATINSAGKIADLESIPAKEREKTKRAGIIASGLGLKEATSLRKEFESLPEVKDFRQMQTSFEKINAVAKQPSAAGDISLVYNYMKMLDPGSTVREGEYATAKNAAGVPQRIANLYNSLKNGQFLSQSQRDDFVNQAKNLYNSQQDLVSKRENDYKGLAGVYGTKPSNVIPRSSQPQSKLSPKDQQALDWARKNPKDQRAQKILQSLGVK